ncbi:hypothetical protein MRB53_037194 [Persea americana]|nr:hypothetical protein MRB53_037194 [Persea americana]
MLRSTRAALDYGAVHGCRDHAHTSTRATRGHNNHADARPYEEAEPEQSRSRLVSARLEMMRIVWHQRQATDPLLGMQHCREIQPNGSTGRQHPYVCPRHTVIRMDGLMSTSRVNTGYHKGIRECYHYMMCKSPYKSPTITASAPPSLITLLPQASTLLPRQDINFTTAHMLNLVSTSPPLRPSRLYYRPIDLTVLAAQSHLIYSLGFHLAEVHSIPSAGQTGPGHDINPS